MPSFDVTEQVVTDLSFGSTVSGVGQVNAPDSSNWDCAIGDLKFLLATSDQYPFVRETAEFRRQRIDTERNPGEQSLDSGYWIRSQASWHYGTGLTSAEPLEVNDEEAQFRYNAGGGVNPWTAGELTLLNATEQVLADAAASQQMLGVGDGVLHASGSTVTHVADDDTVTTVSWGGSGTVTSMTTDGSSYYIADATGIYKGSLPTGAGTKIWDTGATTLVRWVKSRLMAAVGPAVYELTGTGPTLPTALDPGTARPAGWAWTDMTEGPGAIYLAGFVGDTSTIERVSVTASTTTVTLDVPTVVADMPRSETALSLYSYVGTYLLIGTTQGLRVALVNADSSITVGPLTVDAGPVDDTVAIDNYVYATVRDKADAGDRVQRAGLYRVDLGRTLGGNALRFSHAADLTAPSGTSGQARQVSISGGLLWFSVNGSGVYRQTGTFVDSGWVETGRIRLGTVERKGWRDLRLLTATSAEGLCTGYANTDDSQPPSNWNVVITANGDRGDVSGKLTAVAPSPQPSLYVAIQLQSANSGADTAKLIGYQVRAVPAPERTRLLRVPVMLFDFQTDRKGMRLGRPGYAFDTLSKLQELEQTAAVVQWRDYTTGEAATAYVERVTFTRVTPPTNRSSGAGGVGQVLLRLV